MPPSQPSQRGNLACHSTTPTAGNLQSRSCHFFTNSTELLPFPSQIIRRGFPYSSVGKSSVCNAEDPGSIPGSGRSSGEENGNPLLFLPVKSHGQRSLTGVSPCNPKESDRTGRLTLSNGIQCYIKRGSCFLEDYNLMLPLRSD